MQSCYLEPSIEFAEPDRRRRPRLYADLLLDWMYARLDLLCGEVAENFDSIAYATTIRINPVETL